MFSTSLSSGSYTYARVRDGFFVFEVPEGTNGSVCRIKKTGAEVYEKFENTVEGKITFIDIKETEYKGEILSTLNIGLSHIGMKACIQLRFLSKYATGFLNRLEGIDFSQPLTLKVGIVKDRKEDKKTPYLIVIQGGKKVDSYHTKDNPNGLPPLDIVKLRGKNTYDDFNQQEFYKAKIEKFKAKVEANQSPIAPKINQEAVASIDSDDLPF